MMLWMGHISVENLECIVNNLLRHNYHKSDYECVEMREHHNKKMVIIERDLSKFPMRGSHYPNSVNVKDQYSTYD